MLKWKAIAKGKTGAQRLSKFLGDISFCILFCENLIQSIDALNYAMSGEYDSIVMDIMMPEKDGIQVLKELRKHHINTPVLLLTAKTQVAQRVEGLDAGADDYLPKPFSVAELLARVRAMLRRKENYTPELVSFMSVTLNCSTMEIVFEEKLISLSGKEFQVLEMLMKNPRIIIPSEQLMTHIWGWDAAVDISVIWVHISNLRKKLEMIGAPITIKFIRGAGYMLEGRQINRREKYDS